MSHHIYHTRGIILGSTQIGESNRFYRIFTEELGLVRAVAQSVREGKSKLRYVLQDFSFVTLDLVRGKEVWRITSAGEWRFHKGIVGDPVRLALFVRFCALLSRMLQGEGREDKLFTDIISIADFLESSPVPYEFVHTVETLVALRILSRLGYLDSSGYEVFLEQEMITKELIKKFEEVRGKSLVDINRALKSSHL